MYGVSCVVMFVVQVKIWDIPEHGVVKNITVPWKELQGHSRRVGLIEWHPTANNIIFSTGYDYQVLKLYTYFVMEWRQTGFQGTGPKEDIWNIHSDNDLFSHVTRRTLSCVIVLKFRIFHFLSSGRRWNSCIGWVCGLEYILIRKKSYISETRPSCGLVSHQ